MNEANEILYKENQKIHVNYSNPEEYHEKLLKFLKIPR